MRLFVKLKEKNMKNDFLKVSEEIAKRLSSPHPCPICENGNKPSFGGVYKFVEANGKPAIWIRKVKLQ